MKNNYILFGVFFILIGCGSPETPVDSAVESKILHYGNGTEPQGLDPHIVTGVPEHHLLLALCEGLTSSNPKGGESLPGAASSWKISENGKIYTFYLQESGKWSNGDPITAGDFVWSWQRILTPTLGSQYPDMLYYVVGAEEYHTDPNFEVLSKKRSRLDELQTKKIDELTTNELEELEALAVEVEVIEIELSKAFDNVGIKAIDDLTFEVTLKEPTPFFLGLLSHYSTWPVHKETVLKHGSMDDRNGQWTRPGNFVCNGPFNLKSWELNKKIVVEKNSLYWDSDMVELNEIHFYPISVEMTEERMFRAGQLHVTSTFPSSKCTPDIKETNPNIQIHPYMGTYFYRFNTKNDALSDVRVRKALAYSIDREKIVESVTKCGQIPAYSFTPPGSNGFFPDTKIPYDIDLAKELLKEAGYESGTDFPKLEILFNTSEGHRKVALAVQQMWQQNLGINVELVNQDWKVYLSREMIGDFQVSRAGWIGDYEDPNTFLDTLRPNRGNNKTGWENPEFDRLVALANATLDQDERYEILMQAERLLIDEMPIAPIYTYVRVYQLHEDVKGWHPNILSHHHPKYIRIERD